MRAAKFICPILTPKAIVSPFSFSLSSLSSSSAVVQGRPGSWLANRRKPVGNPANHSVLKSCCFQCVKPVHSKQYSSLAWQPGSELAAASVSLDPSQRSCYISWEDGFQSQFHSAWLRHNCHCEECRHPNGQKLLDPTSVSPSLTMDSVTIKGTSLMVTWSSVAGVHRGEIPISFLRSHNYNSESMLARRQQVQCKPVSEIPTVVYHDLLNSKDWLLKWLQQINEDGISIVKDVPIAEDMVQKVGEMIAPLMPTIYGNTFDVEKTPEPINVAYSSLAIGLHQDLVYFESPPGLQLLHCLEFDDCVEGGGNIFLDALEMADKFRVNQPDLFHTLATVPATFQKVHYHRDLPVHIVNQKPHIKLNHLGEVCAVYWAPPFEGPLAVAGKDVEQYFLAYETFAKTLSSSTPLRHRLRPGELVVFNNLRMLHGREGFKTNGGARRLKGCYLNVDIFKSQTQVFNNLVGDGRLAKRVGNQCFF